MPEQSILNEENKTTGNNQRIIVIGASAGGFEAIKTIVKNLPADFYDSIFFVWHMSPDIRSVLAKVLNRFNTVYATHACDKELIKPNRIYVAPPDHHLLIEEGRMRVTHGPKENRFRPAVDPLFRSAAYAYGNRVIGIILSGSLDDETAGLWTVKQHGGIAIVQHPDDAKVSSMPESAMRKVQVDFAVPAADIAGLLNKLSKEKTEKAEVVKDKKTKKEIDIAIGENALEKGGISLGEITPYACPECHGVLSKLTDGDLYGYRCHTGHAYSADVLLAALTRKVENSLYNAIRGMDETIALLNHIGDHLAEGNNPNMAAVYFNKAKETAARSKVVRKAVLHHGQLSMDRLTDEFEGETNSIK